MDELAEHNAASSRNRKPTREAKGKGKGNDKGKEEQRSDDDDYDEDDDHADVAFTERSGKAKEGDDREKTEEGEGGEEDSGTKKKKKKKKALFTKELAERICPLIDGFYLVCSNDVPDPSFTSHLSSAAPPAREPALVIRQVDVKKDEKKCEEEADGG